MHPRKAVRKLIAASLREAFPNVEVSSGSVRDMAADDGILVRVPREYLESQGSNEGGALVPVRRNMSAVVTIFAARPGNGEHSMDAAEDLAELVSSHIVHAFPGVAKPTAEQTDIEEAEEAFSTVILEFEILPFEFDAMNITTLQET